MPYPLWGIADALNEHGQATVVLEVEQNRNWPLSRYLTNSHNTTMQLSSEIGDATVITCYSSIPPLVSSFTLAFAVRAKTIYVNIAKTATPPGRHLGRYHGGSVMSMPQHYVNIFNIRIRIIEIIPGVLGNVCGMIKYPPAFDAAV